MNTDSSFLYLLSGFHELELTGSPEDLRSFRWTSHEARLRLVAGQVRRLWLQLYLVPRAGTVTLHLKAPGGEASVVCPRQEFQLEVPLSPDGAGGDIVLRTDTVVPHETDGRGDFRRLGVQLRRIHWQDLAGQHGGAEVADLREHPGAGTVPSLLSLATDQALVRRAGAVEVIGRAGQNRHLNYGPGRPDGCLDLNGAVAFTSHRSGWGHVLSLLSRWHRAGACGFDGFVDYSFPWRPGTRMDVRAPQGVHARPWVGFIHNPILRGPVWGLARDCQPGSFLRAPGFRQALETCQGLFTPSPHLAGQLAKLLPVPVSSLYHPTEEPTALFSPEAFHTNPDRGVVQLGWHLRKYSSIHRLRTPLRKYATSWGRDGFGDTAALRKQDDSRTGRPPLTLEEERSVTYLQPLPDVEYDRMLSRNVALLHLHDAAANNSLVECMIRGTPVLVNPLPAVLDYLEPGYPLYFHTLKEAAKWLADDGRLAAAHQWLLQPHIRDKVTGRRFLQDLQASPVFRHLQPEPADVSGPGLPDQQRPDHHPATAC